MRAFMMLLLLICSTTVQAAGFPALVYHDIQPAPVTETFTVSTQSFARQMKYLKKKGYQPISLETLQRARRGEVRLPKKPVLLTFDDGLVSYQRYALPILEKYRFPSVLSIVTSWTSGSKVPDTYRGKILSWEAIRKLDQHPLVEVVSHSHALHSGALTNPQGNRKALAIARIYSPKVRRYESEASFRARIQKDIEISIQQFRRHLGRGPVAITWPYGHYEQWHIEAAARMGVTLHLTLDEAPVTTRDLPRINRYLMYNKNRKESFSDVLNLRDYYSRQARFIEIDLAPFAGATAAQQEALLSRLIRRIELLGINSIVVNPFSRDKKHAYFANRSLPVKTNILDRILHQIDARNQITLILRVPVSTPMPAIRELARLHYFHGIILYGGKDGARADKIVRIMKFHRPPLLVGIQDPLNINHDFRYIRLTKTPGVLRGYTPTSYVALPNNRHLVKDFRGKRQTGIAHLGYLEDGYQNNNPDVLQIAPEIRRRSSATARGGL